MTEAAHGPAGQSAPPGRFSYISAFGIHDSEARKQKKPKE
jgi:hypothetical protein